MDAAQTEPVRRELAWLLRRGDSLPEAVLSVASSSE